MIKKIAAAFRRLFTKKKTYIRVTPNGSVESFEL